MIMQVILVFLLLSLNHYIIGKIYSFVYRLHKANFKIVLAKSQDNKNVVYFVYKDLVNVQ